jgi:DUF1016 N-terminal domain
MKVVKRLDRQFVEVVSMIKQARYNAIKNVNSEKGFTRRGLFRMRQFYETYRRHKIVSPLVTQISWTNHLIILSKTRSPE